MTSQENTPVIARPSAIKKHLGPLGLCLSADWTNDGLEAFFVYVDSKAYKSLEGVKGVTDVQVSMLDLLNSTLKEAVDNALNASCKTVQDVLGMMGDYAGIHYSGPENLMEIHGNIASYMFAEIRMNWDEAEPENEPTEV